MYPEGAELLSDEPSTSSSLSVGGSGQRDGTTGSGPVSLSDLSAVLTRYDCTGNFFISSMLSKLRSLLNGIERERRR